MNPQYDPSLIDKVPPSIVSAAMAVSNWFNSQSLHPSPRWEFLSICSRNHADRLKKLERELDFAMTNESIETNENHKLRQRIKRLEEWKESAMAVEREWNPNALATMLGGQPGESQRVVIMREMPKLLDRILDLESALRRIANQDYRSNRSTESQIAFEALKEAKP